VPGFFLPGLTDPVLQEHLEAQHLDSWYYAAPEELQRL
jgi:hypothetical protein